MLPGKMIILLAIAEARGFGEKAPTCSIGDMPGEYVGHLHYLLVRRGYLKRNGLGECQLTSKGREALIEYLYKDADIVTGAIKKLEDIHIEIGPAIDKVKRGVRGVN